MASRGVVAAGATESAMIRRGTTSIVAGTRDTDTRANHVRPSNRAEHGRRIYDFTAQRQHASVDCCRHAAKELEPTNRARHTWSRPAYSERARPQILSGATLGRSHTRVASGPVTGAEVGGSASKTPTTTGAMRVLSLTALAVPLFVGLAAVTPSTAGGPAISTPD